MKTCDFARVLFVAGLAICGFAARAEVRPKIAASIFPIYDLCRRIAGPDADVALLLPPGRSEHGFEPTPKQMKEVSTATLAVGVGLGLDEWLLKLVDRSGSRKIPVLELGTKVHTQPYAHVGPRPAHDDESPGAMDPHFWLEPARLKEASAAIVDALSAQAPEKAAAFHARGKVLDAELDRLNAELTTLSANWKGKGVIAFHRSLGYLTEARGLRTAAVVELQPGREPTPKQMESLIRLAKEKLASIVLTEAQLEAKAALLVCRESKLPCVLTDPVGGLKGRESVEDLILFNARQITGALK